MIPLNVKVSPIDERIKSGEMTPPQVNYIISTQKLMKNIPVGASYTRYREIRRDPTVSLARTLILAVALSGEWSLDCEEETPDEVIELISKSIIPLRQKIVNFGIRGGIDFGWQGFEKIFVNDNGKIVLKDLKPLLHDITEILVIEDTGQFAGYCQTPFTGVEVLLKTSKCFHIAFRVEGTNWYGESLLENIRSTMAKYSVAEEGAAAYDTKVAGSHFVVYYPPGTSIVDGEAISNAIVAKRLLWALENSGSITVPRTVVEYVDQLNTAEENGWKIEILEDAGGRQPTFIERLRYLDAQKVRGLEIPERSILEGEFGTKAEAGEHGDMAVKNIQLADRELTSMVNKQLIDQLLVLNFGLEAKGKVWVSAAPLIDEQLVFLRSLYQSIVNNPAGFSEEFMTLDTDSIKDRLDIPKTAVVAEAGYKQPQFQPESEGIDQDQVSALEKFTENLDFNAGFTRTNLE